MTLRRLGTDKADHHQKAWIKYFAGSWKLQETGGEEIDFKLVADGNATIGTGESPDGQLKSAWITGWNPTENRMIHEWFGVDHGRISYEVVDANTLRGPGAIHSSNRVIKGMVTITKKNDKMYTVHWTDVTVNGKKSDDIHVAAERK